METLLADADLGHQSHPSGLLQNQSRTLEQDATYQESDQTQCVPWLDTRFSDNLEDIVVK
jgi:hypothetical protein